MNDVDDVISKCYNDLRFSRPQQIMNDISLERMRCGQGKKRDWKALEKKKHVISLFEKFNDGSLAKNDYIHGVCVLLVISKCSFI